MPENELGHFINSMLSFCASIAFLAYFFISLNLLHIITLPTVFLYILVSLPAVSGVLFSFFDVFAESRQINTDELTALNETDTIKLTKETFSCFSFDLPIRSLTQTNNNNDEIKTYSTGSDQQLTTTNTTNSK